MGKTFKSLDATHATLDELSPIQSSTSIISNIYIHFTIIYESTNLGSYSAKQSTKSLWKQVFVEIQHFLSLNIMANKLLRNLQALS